MEHQINPQFNHRHELQKSNVLHVIGVISNPAMYHSRYRIFREWYKEMSNTSHVKLYIVEAAYGDRKHEVTEDNNSSHLQIRTTQDIWIKENMINLGVERLLPDDWKYVAWVDCDIFFRNPNWAIETIHQLQHFSVVQPWQQCIDLGHAGNILTTFNSFGYIHQRGDRKQRWSGEPYIYAHSGFAWACTRKLWENMRGKGLLEHCILGSADHHMAWAFIDDVKSTIHNKMSKSYFRLCEEWQKGVNKITYGEVGYTSGRIEHMFHGPKNRRYYRERWQILIDNHFDPDDDLVYSEEGVIYVTGKPKLVHDIRKYNRSRQEDSIEDC